MAAGLPCPLQDLGPLALRHRLSAALPFYSVNSIVRFLLTLLFAGIGVLLGFPIGRCVRAFHGAVDESDKFECASEVLRLILVHPCDRALPC